MPNLLVQSVKNYQWAIVHNAVRKMRPLLASKRIIFNALEVQDRSTLSLRVNTIVGTYMQSHSTIDRQYVIDALKEKYQNDIEKDHQVRRAQDALNAITEWEDEMNDLIDYAVIWNGLPADLRHVTTDQLDTTVVGQLQEESPSAMRGEYGDQPAHFYHMPATQRQADFLSRLGHKGELKNMAEASFLINKYKKERGYT